MGQMIFDKLTDIPTVLSTNRSKRPDQTGVEHKKPAKKKDKGMQPKIDFFAKGHEDATPPTVYKDQDDWNVRVFANKFKILENHEVIVHSPSIEDDLEDFPQEQVVRYIRAILNRVGYYTEQDLEVFIFNNRGAKAGASVEHPHSQLVALRGFPGIIQQKREGALHYYDEHGTCYWCDLLKTELEKGTRVVYESSHYAILVPEASRWGYETVLMPKRHLPNIAFINEEEINDLAAVLQGLLRAYDKLFDGPDRNFWFHTQRNEPFHWHMGFYPHQNTLAGLEIGAGIWVNGKADPEDAAKELGALVKECCDAPASTADPAQTETVSSIA